MSKTYGISRLLVLVVVGLICLAAPLPSAAKGSNSRLALTIIFYGERNGYRLPLDYTIYVDHKPVDFGRFTEDELKADYHLHGIRHSYSKDVEPGKHTVTVLIEAFPADCYEVPRSPFLASSRTVSFESGRVGEITLNFDPEGPGFLMRPNPGDADAGLDDLAAEVNRKVDRLEHDKLYTELQRIKSQRRAGKTVYLDIYGGVELDRYEVDWIAEWLRRRYLSVLTDDLSGNLPIPLMDLTEAERKRYFHLEVVIDSHSRALRDIDNYLNDTRIWKD